MSDTGPADTRRRFSMRTSRMEALSDGIFAFAATLLVLDLVVPAAVVLGVLAAVTAGVAVASAAGVTAAGYFASRGSQRAVAAVAGGGRQ